MTKFRIFDSTPKDKPSRETQLLYYFSPTTGWTKASNKVQQYKEVIYLGKDYLSDMDIFLCLLNNESKLLFYGVKGDEFD